MNPAENTFRIAIPVDLSVYVPNGTNGGIGGIVDALLFMGKVLLFFTLEPITPSTFGGGYVWPGMSAA